MPHWICHFWTCSSNFFWISDYSRVEIWSWIGISSIINQICKNVTFSSILVEVYLRALSELGNFPGCFGKPNRSSFMFCLQFPISSVPSSFSNNNWILSDANRWIWMISHDCKISTLLKTKSCDESCQTQKRKQNVKEERLCFLKCPGKYANSVGARRYT